MNVYDMAMHVKRGIDYHVEYVIKEEGLVHIPWQFTNGAPCMDDPSETSQKQVKINKGAWDLTMNAIQNKCPSWIDESSIKHGDCYLVRKVKILVKPLNGLQKSKSLENLYKDGFPMHLKLDQAWGKMMYLHHDKLNGGEFHEEFSTLV